MEKVTQKCFLAKKGEIPRDWVVVDLSDKVLGRAATRIADLLRGKDRPNFTRHEDMGHFVVAINAAKIKLTGNKWKDKKYYRHSGFRGGIKETSAAELLQRHPTDLITKAVKGMLPKNRMQEHLLKKFKVFAGAEHPHAAQQPKTIEI